MKARGKVTYFFPAPAFDEEGTGCLPAHASSHVMSQDKIMLVALDRQTDRQTDSTARKPGHPPLHELPAAVLLRGYAEKTSPHPLRKTSVGYWVCSQR